MEIFIFCAVPVLLTVASGLIILCSNYTVSIKDSIKHYQYINFYAIFVRRSYQSLKKYPFLNPFDSLIVSTFRFNKVFRINHFSSAGNIVRNLNTGFVEFWFKFNMKGDMGYIGGPSFRGRFTNTNQLG